MSLYIRTAEGKPGVKYEMVEGDTGAVVKEYTEADEPVDFNGEIEKAVEAQAMSEADALRAQVANLQQVVADMADLLLEKGVLP